MPTAYKPPVTSSYQSGEKGHAKIAKSKKGFVVTFEESEASFVIAPENVPDWLAESTVWSSAKPVLSGYVELSGDGKKIFKAMPNRKGKYTVRVSHISPREKEGDKLPIPRVVEGKFGPYSVFYLVFKIEQGSWKGAELSKQYNYKFVTSGDEVGLNTKKASPANADLERMLSETGIWDYGAIKAKYADNVLPVLESRMSKSDFLFEIMVEPSENGGYPQIVYLTRLEDEEEDLDAGPDSIDDDEIPAPTVPDEDDFDNAFGNSTDEDEEEELPKPVAKKPLPAPRRKWDDDEE